MPEAVQQPLVAAPALAHAHGQVEVHAAAELALELLRAAVPIALTIRPPAPIRIPFCDSVSTQTRARTTSRPSLALLDLVDLDLDRVRHLLARAPQHLLAHELGEPHLARLVARVLAADRGTGPRAASDTSCSTQRPDARAGARADREDLAADAELGRGGQRLARCAGWSSRSTLLTAVTTGTPALLSASAMKRSPGPTSCSPFSTNSAASASRQLALDAALHALGERVARALHAGQVDEHELPRRRRSRRRGSRGASSAACRRRSRPSRRRCALTSVDLPTFGPPGERDEAGAGHSSLQHSPLEREHLAVVGLVVHAAQVQHAVDDRLAQVLGVLRADHDVAELARPGRRAALVDREGEHVGRLVAAAVLAVERRGSRSASTSSTARWPSSTPGGGERGERRRRRSSLGRVDELDLDHGRPAASPAGAAPGAAAGACCSACSL